MLVKALSEFDLITRIKEKARCRSPLLLCGIGDDCAVIASGPGEVELLTTDLLIQDVHFKLNFCHPFRLGQKALAINLSDLAAMAGQPQFYLAFLACPPATRVDTVDDIYAGMESVAEEFGLTLVGGDTCQASCLLIGVMAIGRAPRNQVVLRSGARPSDAIYVTGPLGDAALGLKILMQAMVNRRGPVTWEKIARQVLNIFPKEALPLVEKQLAPRPLVREGRELAGLASAMIDISDGLLADLGHICQESKVGAILKMEAVPVSREFRRVARHLGADLSRLPLSAGEDYQLLFTVPQSQEKRLPQLSFFPGLHKLGQITDEPGKIQLRDALGHEMAPGPTGYDHFTGDQG